MPRHGKQGCKVWWGMEEDAERRMKFPDMTGNSSASKARSTENLRIDQELVTAGTNVIIDSSGVMLL
jgi:hypothetical protein